MKTIMNEENKNTNEIENLRKQSEEYLNGWKRAKADYLNLKKEMEAQNKEIKEWLSKIFLLPVLDIMDSFDKAFSNIPEGLKTEVWVEGIESIKKRFEDFLKTQGVEAMEVIGEKFDPAKQEAIESADGGESGRIIEEARRGYLINGEVLRPAKVKVYK
ncbi:MAG: nucleotide exchange factor GrpE [bacterium]|nr:nucleotide exchange factor GrpE [Candidatus Omnitrophota bacterium]MDP2945853.1 nucleotide exchange factor GrpE [bacterium]